MVFVGAQLWSGGVGHNQLCPVCIFGPHPRPVENFLDLCRLTALECFNALYDLDVDIDGRELVLLFQFNNSVIGYFFLFAVLLQEQYLLLFYFV